jgi:hypothetical protein
MSSIVIHSRSGPDGKLHLEVDLGPEFVNREFQVTITLLPRPLSQEEHASIVQAQAGSIADPTFVRHPQCMRCNDQGTGQINSRDEV